MTVHISKLDDAIFNGRDGSSTPRTPLATKPLRPGSFATTVAIISIRAKQDHRPSEFGYRIHWA